MNITIEKAAPSDAAEFLEYLRQVGKETDNLTFGSEGVPFTVEAEAEYLKNSEGSRDSIMLVAKKDGKIIGNAALSRLTRRMSHRGNFAIAVLKDYWHCGVGSSLLREILRFAKDNSFEIIDLEVRCDNTTAIRLYEKFGFKKLFTYPAFFKIGEEYIDFDYMCLRLK